MRTLFIILLVSAKTSFGQPDSSQWLRGFPITDYMLVLNDSTMVVQLEMPEELKLKDKQLGMMFGTYRSSLEDAVQKGYGRCYLVKGVYHYFAMGHNESKLPLQKGDLVYTFLPKSNIHYERIAKIAGHFIRLQDVYGKPYYDRYNIFLQWTGSDEKAIIDSIAGDIQLTGQYYLANQPSMDQEITKGEYKGQKLLYIMAECQPEDVIKFLDYVIARPRAYAGKEWKTAEIFATWLTNGAPVAKGF